MNLKMSKAFSRSFGGSYPSKRADIIAGIVHQVKDEVNYH